MPWLSSVVLARTLIIALAIVLIVASLGQSGKFGVQAQQVLGKLYFSKGFAILCGFLLLNIFLCTVKQVRKARTLEQSDITAGNSLKMTLIKRGRIDALVLSKLAVPGWNRRVLADDTLLLRKNRFGYWGSVIFHTGLMLIMLGAFYDTFLGFQGSFGLMKGQFFNDTPAEYTDTRKGWFNREKGNEFRVFLHDIREEYIRQGVKAYGDFTLMVDGVAVKRGLVSSSKPVTYKGLTFYKETFGYFTGISISSPAQKKSAHYRIGLGTHIYPSAETYTRTYDFPGEPYRIYFNFLPDYNGNKSKPGTLSYKRKNPYLELHVYEKSTKRVLFKGLIRLGQKVVLKDGSELRFHENIPYFAFNVRKGYGYIPVYAGFLVATLGMTLFYWLTPKKIVIKVEMDAEASYLVVYSYSHRFRESFKEEMEGIVHYIQKFIEEEPARDFS